MPARKDGAADRMVGECEAGIPRLEDVGAQLQAFDQSNALALAAGFESSAHIGAVKGDRSLASDGDQRIAAAHKAGLRREHCDAIAIRLHAWTHQDAANNQQRTRNWTNFHEGLP